MKASDPVPSLRRYSSFEELKSDISPAKESDVIALQEYKAFMELLQKSFAARKAANPTYPKSKKANG